MDAAQLKPAKASSSASPSAAAELFQVYQQSAINGKKKSQSERLLQSFFKNTKVTSLLQNKEIAESARKINDEQERLERERKAEEALAKSLRKRDEDDLAEQEALLSPASAAASSYSSYAVPVAATRKRNRAKKSQFLPQPPSETFSDGSLTSPVDWQQMMAGTAYQIGPDGSIQWLPSPGIEASYQYPYYQSYYDQSSMMMDSMDSGSEHKQKRSKQPFTFQSSPPSSACPSSLIPSPDIFLSDDGLDPSQDPYSMYTPSAPFLFPAFDPSFSYPALQSSGNGNLSSLMGGLALSSSSGPVDSPMSSSVTALSAAELQQQTIAEHASAVSPAPFRFSSSPMQSSTSPSFRLSHPSGRKSSVSFGGAPKRTFSSSSNSPLDDSDGLSFGLSSEMRDSSSFSALPRRSSVFGRPMSCGDLEGLASSSSFKQRDSSFSNMTGMFDQRLSSFSGNPKMMFRSSQDEGRSSRYSDFLNLDSSSNCMSPVISPNMNMFQFGRSSVSRLSSTPASTPLAFGGSGYEQSLTSASSAGPSVATGVFSPDDFLVSGQDGDQ